MRALRIYTASAQTEPSSARWVRYGIAGIRDEGMKGGGQSRCQFASGKTIRADFSPT
jgi:hypothetical protein